MILLVWADADVDVCVVEEEAGPGDHAVAVVVGEEDAGTDDLGGVDQLFDGHGVGLVAREEGDVDVFELGHLGDVLSVASNVDAQAVDGEYIAVVTTLGMELLAAWCGVIGGYSLQGDVAANGDTVAVFHRHDVGQQSGHSGVAVGNGLRPGELSYGGALVVVGVLVGDDDVVGHGHGGEVGDGLEGADGVDVEVATVILDLHGGMLDTGDDDVLARGRLECVALKFLS